MLPRFVPGKQRAAAGWPRCDERGSSRSVDALVRIAEAKIRAAIEAGELDDLPGKGRPLELDDDRGVPADLRMAFRVLKRANVLPEELLLRKEIVSLEAMIVACEDEREARRLTSVRSAKALRYRTLVERRLHGPVARRYGAALRRRLGL